MKKLCLYLFTTLIVVTFSYGQKSVTLKSIVSESEFEEMDEIDQKIISAIDASIFALKGMNLNKELEKKKAVITFSLKEKKLLDTLTLEDQGSTAPLDAQSCEICDMLSGIRCFRRIREQLPRGVIIVRVELVSNCVVLTWD